MSQYPRPDNFSGPYPKDKGWGIAIIAASILGVLCGFLATVGGAIMGGLGAATAASGGREGTEGAVALGAGGGILAMVGFAIMACSAIQVAGGVGVMQGRRWGFVLTAVLSAISLLLNIPNLPQGVIGVAISALFLYYCYQRLWGKEGPTPA